MACILGLRLTAAKRLLALPRHTMSEHEPPHDRLGDLMTKYFGAAQNIRRAWVLMPMFCVALAARSQQAPPAPASPPSASTQQAKPQAETRITPEQAKQLFSLVDQLL